MKAYSPPRVSCGWKTTPYMRVLQENHRESVGIFERRFSLNNYGYIRKVLGPKQWYGYCYRRLCANAQVRLSPCYLTDGKRL